MAEQAIDPQTGPAFALAGTVVTMDSDGTVLERGTIYVDKGTIVSVQETGSPPPDGFEDAVTVRTGGSIYPGLIDLHNHLAYDVLTLWNVPRLFAHRGLWSSHPDKRRLITIPMTVLGKHPRYVPAVVRYVEAKAVMGGTTTSQGITLFSNAGIKKFHRGIVRNVEDTDEGELPEADARIPDIAARDAARFRERLDSADTMLLHLAEGLGDSARKHFLALNLPDGDWAITGALAAIHAAGLEPEDFQVLGERGAAMVWSPFSNYLLYGGTANVAAARAAGVTITLGPDWSPSGSKNLLGELKVAKLVSDLQGGLFTEEEIVAMATRNAASVLGWPVGSIEAGKRADLVVLSGRAGDPYHRMIQARETSITLVVINGVTRYGQPRLMEQLGETTEEINVGRSRRAFDFAQETADQVVGGLSLGQATDMLTDGLSRVPELARILEAPAGPIDAFHAPGAPEMWVLELEQDEITGSALRHAFPGPDGVSPVAAAPAPAAAPMSEIAEPVPLDPLTVADDSAFFKRVAEQQNLPDGFAESLRALY